MTLTLYLCNDDKRKVNKTLNNGTEFQNVHLKDDCTIENPVFKLTGINENGKPKKFNYVYSPYFDRYYFINPDGIKFCTGGIVEISCHVDVLYTYRTNINASSATIVRQKNKFFKNNQQKNGIFFDSNYPIRADVTCYDDPIGEVASGELKYYLTVNGD